MGMGKLVVGATVGMVAALSSYAGANLIMNGAFDDEGTVMPVINDNTRAYGTYAYGADGCVVPGWTLTGYAGLCVSNSAFLADMADTDVGRYALFFRAGQASALEQTFSVPVAGCYRLAFDYWAWQTGNGSSTLTVKFACGSVTNTLASLTPNNTSGLRERFSVPVNVPAVGSCTLLFSQPSTGANIGVTIDNLSFVRCGELNLVQNGDFEQGAISGSNYSRIGNSGYSNPHWTGGDVADSKNWMGLCVYNKGGFFPATYWKPGKYALFMRNTAATDTSLAQQEINFAEPGLYRVSFSYFGWVDAREHLSTEVRLAHGATTNVIGAIDHADARCGRTFACTCYAEIAEAGTYALQFSIPGNTAVATANIIDNVVVNRCGAPNLIQNGSFDAGGGTVVNYIKSTAIDFSNPHWSGSKDGFFGLAVPNRGFHVNTQAPHVMGKYALCFCRSGLSAWQSFNVAEAGFYHLSFVHWGWNLGGIPTNVKVLQVKDGGATTNVCGNAVFTPLAEAKVGSNYNYYEVSQFNGLVYIPEAGECVLSFATQSGYDSSYATFIDSVSFVKYDADEFAAGDEVPIAVDMLPVSSDGSVVVPHAVYTELVIVESGQVVKMGRHTHAAYNPVFARNDGTIEMDELKIDTQFSENIHLNGLYSSNSIGVLRTGKIIDAMAVATNGNPRLRLHALSGTAKYVVGAGGFSFLNNRRFGYNCQPYYAIEKPVRIDPSADYAIAENPYNNNNQAMWIFENGTLALGTTDYDDPSVARTVTFNGGIGAYAGGVLNVEGIGTVVFSATSSGGFAGEINVKDTATLFYGDRSIPGKGTINVKSGATLKVSRSSGLAIGSALACEGGAILEFDVSRLGEGVAAVTLNGFTPPESGRVTVKVTGREGGGARTLLANLPDGVTKANFLLDKAGLPGNVSLMVRDGCLIIRPCGFMMIVM